MVCRLDPADCYCPTCDGGQKAPEGYFGGTFCPCDCHALKGEERTAFIQKHLAAQKSKFDELIEKASERK